MTLNNFEDFENKLKAYCDETINGWCIYRDIFKVAALIPFEKLKNKYIKCNGDMGKMFKYLQKRLDKYNKDLIELKDEISLHLEQKLNELGYYRSTLVDVIYEKKYPYCGYAEIGMKDGKLLGFHMKRASIPNRYVLNETIKAFNQIEKDYESLKKYEFNYDNCKEKLEKLGWGWDNGD